jgi:hypothetical protein
MWRMPPDGLNECLKSDRQAHPGRRRSQQRKQTSFCHLELPLVLPGADQHPELCRFCDRHADRLAAQAQSDQLTDPTTVRRLWAQADRATDQDMSPVLNQKSTIFLSSRAGNYDGCH